MGWDGEGRGWGGGESFPVSAVLKADALPLGHERSCLMKETTHANKIRGVSSRLVVVTVPFHW